MPRSAQSGIGGASGSSLTGSVASKPAKRPGCEANHRGAAVECDHHSMALCSRPIPAPRVPLLPLLTPLFDRNAACAPGRILPGLASSVLNFELEASVDPSVKLDVEIQSFVLFFCSILQQHLLLTSSSGKQLLQLPLHSCPSSLTGLPSRRGSARSTRRYRFKNRVSVLPNTPWLPDRATCPTRSSS